MLDAISPVVSVIVSVWVAVSMSVLISVFVATDEKASEDVESIESLVVDIPVSLVSLDGVFNSSVDEVVFVEDR